ncbi:hypothetical protein MKW98_003158 [Papaver atlanticum]|uniref:Protein kinase domain-containing protein n=1 Tax=Papaver atlanticum TaxID=357466 RepID=A0AAD4XXW5_9MAGN|nr:hypothetical protein MKW98_003158 [Papaver atlanticum]
MDRLSKKLQESLVSEIVILKNINHPNIIQLHDIIEVQGRIHLILEYCKGGDLSMHIQRKGKVAEETTKHFIQQLGFKIHNTVSLQITTILILNIYCCFLQCSGFDGNWVLLVCFDDWAYVKINQGQ